VQHHDWAHFLRLRLDARVAGAPLDGLVRGGWKLVYTEEPGSLGKALEKYRDLRYQSAAELRTDLKRLQRDTQSGRVPAQVTSAKPVGGFSFPKIAKWVAGVAVVLVVLGLGWFYGSRKESAAPNAAMTQRQLITSASGRSIGVVAMSRDGKYLAYGNDQDIFIEEIDTGNTHTLATGKGFEVGEWYPDGVRLLVWHGSDIFTLFVPSGEKHRLASNVFSANLSPDGSQILLDSNSKLMTMPSSGGESKVVMDSPSGTLITPAWSPDGKAIAYIRSDSYDSGGTLEIRRLADGKTKVLLVDKDLGGGNGSVVQWIPDGRILFDRLKGFSESDLWSISLDSNLSASGPPVRITNTAGSFIQAISSSADGKRMAVQTTRYPLSIYVAGLSKDGDRLEKPFLLTNDYWSNRPDAWSADSQTLFYESERGSRSIYRRTLAASSEELILGGNLRRLLTPMLRRKGYPV